MSWNINSNLIAFCYEIECIEGSFGLCPKTVLVQTLHRLGNEGRLCSLVYN